MSQDTPRRHSMRLRGYDYSQNGVYFVTICTQDKKSLFGDVVDDEIRLNEVGNIAKNEWLNLPRRFPNLDLDISVIMPNHIHGIIIVGAPLAGARINKIHSQIKETHPRNHADNIGIHVNNDIYSNRATARVAHTPIGNIIGAYKSLVYTTCLKINKGNKRFQGKMWQRNYYEHIIRDDYDLNRIREYIIDNPANWSSDISFIP
ncbi:MAG: hypothetical protein UW16_C0002G0007 [Microgenomates group bacterium GW2011_GWC1_44_10]|nr:MAG: hypothetical protein UW16_C0002G0007 [Microgenomates group bacterium GW2011_GWC1_44_10]